MTSNIKYPCATEQNHTGMKSTSRVKCLKQSRLKILSNYKVYLAYIRISMSLPLWVLYGLAKLT